MPSKYIIFFICIKLTSSNVAVAFAACVHSFNKRCTPEREDLRFAFNLAEFVMFGQVKLHGNVENMET